MNPIWLWVGFAVVVVGILAFDLGVVGARKREIGPRQAALMVAGYVLLAALFGIGLSVVKGTGAGLEYFTAYLLEVSLSLDNIFLWILIFEYLGVPNEAQHRVLFWGIIGAIVLRGAFIFAGAALIDAFDWVLPLFGALVIVSAIRLLRGAGKARSDVGDSRLLRFIRRHLNVTDSYQSKRFFVFRNGVWYATPLFLALLVIELTDLMFALDSVPAIFGVTRDRLVVYTSNIFAILGLRAAYFAVADMVERLRYLRYGLALLLLLIGVKMIASGFVEIPLWATLAATVTVLATTIAASLLWRPSRVHSA